MNESRRVSYPRACMLLITAVLFAYTVVYFGGVTVGGKYVLAGGAALISLCWMVSILLTRTVIVVHSALLIPFSGMLFILYISQLNSIYSYNSFISLSPFLACYLIYATLVANFRKEEWVFITHISIILAVGVSLFGLMAFLFHRYDLWWHSKNVYLERLTGTFINPNHCACFISCIAPWTLYFIMQNRLQRWWYVVSLITIMTALVFTASYTGIIGLIVGILILLILSYSNKLMSFRRYRIIVLFLTCVIVLFCSLFTTFFLNSTLLIAKMYSLAHHFYACQAWWGLIHTTAQTEPLRILTGIGVGNLHFVINTHYPNLTMTTLDHIHNDVMELFAETGVLGIAMLICAFIITVIDIKRKLELATENEHRLWIICTYSSLSVLAVHICFDFILSVPCILLFLVLCIAFLDRDTPRIGTQDILYRYGTSAFLVLLTIICVYSASSSYLEERIANMTRQLVKQGKHREALEILDSALLYHGRDAQLIYEKGELFSLMASREQSKELKTQHLLFAQKYFLRALAINPYNAQTYVRLAHSYVVAGDATRAQTYYKQALARSPNTISLRLKYIDFLCRSNHNEALNEITTLVHQFHMFTFQDITEKSRILWWLTTKTKELPRDKTSFILQLLELQKKGTQETTKGHE